jgi:hypothetical protein
MSYDKSPNVVRMAEFSPQLTTNMSDEIELTLCRIDSDIARILGAAEPCHLEDEVIGQKLRAVRDLGEFRMCQIFQKEGEGEG